MADIRLFQLQSDSARELPAESVDIEKSLQSLLEQHLESFLGVRFLATEYVTGKAHGGRIDTLGLDDNNCPVIIEYKRALNQNIISQGLFYLDWLMDHQGEFTLQVLNRLGKEWAQAVVNEHSQLHAYSCRELSAPFCTISQRTRTESLFSIRRLRVECGS
jgi:RecB family endonuclease NucS